MPIAFAALALLTAQTAELTCHRPDAAIHKFAGNKFTIIIHDTLTAEPAVGVSEAAEALGLVSAALPTLLLIYREELGLDGSVRSQPEALELRLDFGKYDPIEISAEKMQAKLTWRSTGAGDPGQAVLPVEPAYLMSRQKKIVALGPDLSSPESAKLMLMAFGSSSFRGSTATLQYFDQTPLVQVQFAARKQAPELAAVIAWRKKTVPLMLQGKCE